MLLNQKLETESSLKKKLGGWFIELLQKSDTEKRNEQVLG
jgi:hypothetical protein